MKKSYTSFFFAISAKVRKCTEVGLLVSGAEAMFYQKIEMKFQKNKLKIFFKKNVPLRKIIRMQCGVTWVLSGN